MIDLGYEQYVALRIMRDEPNLEASVIAKNADCSWNELYALEKRGLIDLGANVELKQLHPTITATGLKSLEKAEQDDII